MYLAYLFSTPKKSDEISLKRYLKHVRFSYPVYVDEANSFNLLNNFPKEDEFQTFLINSENKVIAIGNPVHNTQIKNIYLDIIRGYQVKYEKRNKLIKTIVNVDKESFVLGSFPWQEEQKSTFSLKNVGDNPLVVQDVVTSCGCTSVEYSKEPVRPGDSLSLYITYKADQPAHFSKTITVYCNAVSSPIRLFISGNAE